MLTLKRFSLVVFCSSLWGAKLQAAAVQLSGVATHPNASNLSEDPPADYAPIPWQLTIPTTQIMVGGEASPDDPYFFTFTRAMCWMDGKATEVEGQGYVGFWDALGKVSIWVETFKPPLESVLLNPPEFILKVEASLTLELTTPLEAMDRAKALQFLEMTPEFSRKLYGGSTVQLDATPYARWAKGLNVSWVAIPEPGTSLILSLSFLVFVGMHRRGFAKLQR